MRRLSALPALLLCLALIVAPILAQARVGAGGSFGSRGGRTYMAPGPTGTSPYGAAPMPGGAAAQGYGAGYGGGYGYGRSGLGAGLMGGLLGFGLGRMMFGHGFGFGGGLGIIGLLLRLAILFFLVRWAFRRFFGGTATAPAAGMFAPPMGLGPMPFAAPAASLGAPIAIQPVDYQAFEVLLKNIQAAWSNADMTAMRGFATPEMTSVFAQQLADNTRRGRRNVVTDVHLQQGDLSEAWSEGGATYATVAMRFSMVDITYDLNGHIIEGAPSEHVTATEYWTFLRAPGGHWLLSAIQQAR